MTERPIRPAVPFRLNLDQQKTRARDLLRAVRAGDAAALARWRTHRPAAAPEAARLADAQFVIARELGSPSWPRLKAHILAMGRARAAITGGDPPPDGDRRTLHVRCGSDIRTALGDAGFAGDFLEHSDPCCQGPVPEGPDLHAVRVRFLTGAFGGLMDLSADAIADKLRREEEGLAAAAGYERVVLWCEHDSYDQLCLARWLARFAESGAPPVTELVSISHFPGAARFIGLGQLPPEGLRLLWPTRHRLAPADLTAGRRAWDALRSPDPRALAALARSAMPGLPDLPGALHRHLRELPWTGDGLSLTERFILELVGSGDFTVGRIYAEVMNRREPRPWLSDLMFLVIVQAMLRAAEPPFAIDGDGAGRPWPQWPLRITDAGAAVLRGARDWLSLGPPERWVGGVRIVPGAGPWRWDDAAGEPVRA
ncbi:DUF1835 domain-containing protein [Azospirillum halopraeferens]|uniref:DUF1835 domain-containing protein n=1 Tax=Azospirillum halopraeferens TaxID=34010 RepID=UPI00041CD400|nr:hypothetical protein [Azospirillum halopraeferens]